MTANSVIEEARVAHVREQKTALAETKERLARIEEERDSLLAHFDLALVALHDFEQMGEGAQLQIIDGWNAILRHRNVSKLTSEEISKLKADYLANLGIVPQPSTPNSQPSTRIWIVFDGSEENSYRSASYRVTYTGGSGAHRADRLILDYVHAVRLLGFDTARITVDTADKALAKKLTALGAQIDSSAIGLASFGENAGPNKAEC